MAVIDINLSDIVDSCPNLVITDSTDYTDSGYYPYADFKFNDYSTTTPTVNSSFTFSGITFGTVDLSAVSITVETDGTGNIVDPKIQYQALVDAINDQGEAILATLVSSDETDFTEWYIRILSYEQAQAGGATSVTVGAGISPSFGTISSTTANIDVRNLTLTDNEGDAINLGAVAQVSTLTLDNSLYTIGQTFSLDFCGEIVTFDVTKTPAICVAQGIVDAINAITDTSSLYFRYIEATYSGNVITFKAKEAGVPFTVNVTYTGAEAFTYATTTANVSSMLVPSQVNTNDFTYAVDEKGGLYTATLTVVSDCDYNVGTTTKLSWCYDINKFDCCFVDLIAKSSCCSKKEDALKAANRIHSIIRAIPLMISKSYKQSEIQSVVNIGYSVCDSDNCGCGC